MKPSEGFLKDLRGVSPDLWVEWNRDLERWVIWYRSPDNQDHRITEVKNEDGSYRPLDNRIIELLKQWDMSTKVNHHSYYFSKQYENVKKHKEETRRRNREEALAKSRELGSQWNRAIDNANKGIFNDRQLGRKVIYSFAPPKEVSQTLLRKLGKPRLTGIPIDINPK